MVDVATKEVAMHSLPLIEFANKFLKDGSLEDCYIIGVQHLLPTTHGMFQALFKKGLKPENLSLIGKCYSTDLAVYAAMKAEGIDVCPSSLSFDSHLDYDAFFENNVEQFICRRKAKINAPQFRRVIFLDDGGDFLNLVTPHLERTDGICGMEQTSSGYNRLVDKQHPFPIVNLARSFAKLQCEPKKIVDLCLQKMDAYLAESKKEIQKVLVIGNGAVGGEIYRTLQNRYDVSLYDIISNLSHFPEQDLHHQLGKFDLIIGCSGKTSLPAEYHPYLKKGCVLVSVSSSDREFDGAHLRKKAARTSNCFDHIVSDVFVLLNCGFPIGFDGAEDVDDPQFFQFIRALIISCIAQAEEQSVKKGFVPLKPEFQLQLLREFHTLGKFSLKEQREHLQKLLGAR